LKKTIGDLLESYKSVESFPSVAEFTERFNLKQAAAVHSHVYLKDNNIDSLFSEEVIEVATRVNYGSNLNEIHALGALVSMAADDALQVQDGNFQIFEGMVARSQAEVRLNTKITRVKKLAPEYEGAESRFEITTLNGQKEVFDTIVIGAPIVSGFPSLHLHTFLFIRNDVVHFPPCSLFFFFSHGKSSPVAPLFFFRNSNLWTLNLTWICHLFPKSTTGRFMRPLSVDSSTPRTSTPSRPKSSQPISSRPTPMPSYILEHPGQAVDGRDRDKDLFTRAHSGGAFGSTLHQQDLG